MTDHIEGRGMDLTQFEGHTPGPWALWTGCSWRRFGQEQTQHSVCEPISAQSDNHPDLYFRNGGQDGPDARLIAAAPTLLAELVKLRAEMREYANDATDARATNRELRAKVEELEDAEQRLAFLEEPDPTDLDHPRRYWRNATDADGDSYDECVICALEEAQADLARLREQRDWWKARAQGLAKGEHEVIAEALAFLDPGAGTSTPKEVTS